MTNGNGKKTREAFIGLLLLTALILAVVWRDQAADAESARESMKKETKKYEKTAKVVKANAGWIFADRDREQGTEKLVGKPAISIITQLAVSCGISEKLIRVIPEENKKKKEMTAKVVLKGVHLNDIVNFLVYLRKEYPGVFDREARIRLAAKGEDRWDAGLALTYAQ